MWKCGAFKKKKKKQGIIWDYEAFKIYIHDLMELESLSHALESVWKNE